MSRHGEEPATVRVTTGVRERRLLWLRWHAHEGRTLARDEGFRLFAERFLASPHRMVVVVPEFANFSAEFNQSFVYMPLAAFDQPGDNAAEREFVRAALDRIRPQHAEAGESAEVLLVDGRFAAELKGGVGVAWTAPFDVIARSGRIVSKRTALAAVLPALRRGLGPEEGGVYTPYGGDGIFHLLSV